LRAGDLITKGPWVDVRAYGAVGDGVTDDTAAIQAAIDNAIAFGGLSVRFPQTTSGEYRITAKLTTSDKVTLEGDSQYHTRIVADGCDGIEVAAGVSGFSIRNIEVAQAIRYTTTPNSYVGLTFLGSTGSRPQNAILRDVFFDGFGTSIVGNWLWNSEFNNIHAAYTHVGLKLNGLSVNNRISDSSISCDSSAGSRGLKLGDGSTASEGIMITNSLIYAAEIIIEVNEFANGYISNCILDEAGVTGISITGGPVSSASGWGIKNNFIGVTGAASFAGIAITNTLADSQGTWNTIAGNRFVAYSGGLDVTDYGVRIVGTEAKGNIISGNTFVGFDWYDISSDTELNTIVVNNTLGSTGTTSGVRGASIVSGNNGVESYMPSTPSYTIIANARKVTYGEAPPGGTWNLGDIAIGVNMYASTSIADRPLFWYCGTATCTTAANWTAVYPVFLATPASATALGKPGMVAVDDNYIYWNHPSIDNTWRRAAGAGW